MTPRDPQRQLRQLVIRLVERGSAHLDFDAAVAMIPAASRGKRPKGSPHTPWMLLEHLRLAQRDILDYVRTPGHVSPPWPEGYWPSTDAPKDARAWQRAVAGFRADRRALVRLLRDIKRDLLAPIPFAGGVTLLHEALLVADHNAYHVGQMVLLGRMLGEK